MPGAVTLYLVDEVRQAGERQTGGVPGSVPLKPGHVAQQVHWDGKTRPCEATHRCRHKGNKMQTSTQKAERCLRA